MSDDKRIFILALDDYEQAALDELLAQWRAKRNRNALRTGFYDMKNSERHLMGSEVPDVVKRRRFVLGWSAIAVDKLARRCNLHTFYDEAGNDLESLGIGTIVRDNRLVQETYQAGVSSLIHSCSFLWTTPGDTRAGEPPVLMNTRSAEAATAVWDARRRAARAFLSLDAFDGFSGEPTEMTLVLPNLNVFLTRVGGGRWTVQRRKHPYGVPVDPLRYKARTGRDFGSSRITRTVMSLHEQALGAMIRADVNGEAYSLARYVLLGASEEAFRNADGSSRPSWEAAWRAIWAIGDDPDAEGDLARADVKQFSGQSPEPQNAHLRMIGQLFSGETGVPVAELGFSTEYNPTSADSLLVSRDDLIIEANQTMSNWSPDLGSAAQRALAMLNKGKVPRDLYVLPRWHKPVTVSPAAAADAGTKQIGALPWLADTEIGLDLLGLTPEQAARALQEKRRAEGSQILNALRQAAATETAAQEGAPGEPEQS